MLRACIYACVHVCVHIYIYIYIGIHDTCMHAGMCICAWTHITQCMLTGERAGSHVMQYMHTCAY